LGYDRGLDRVNLYPARITRAVQIEQGAIGGAGPGPQLATAQFGLAPPSHALGNQGPLILRDRTANLQEQLIMRVITHRTLDKLDPTAALGEFIDQEHLMDIIAGQAIRGSDQDTFEGRHGGPIPETIEPGSVEGSPAIAVITIDVLFGDLPLGVCRRVVAEAMQLLVNRLLLLLTARRDTDVESDFHEVPPDEALAQGKGLRWVPWPIAEGTGMHNPTVVHRHAVPL